MIIKKTALMILLTLILSKDISASTLNHSCNRLFKKFHIEPKIQSDKGWLRVYKDGDLFNYLNISKKYQNDVLRNKLKNCLYTNGFKYKSNTIHNKLKYKERPFNFTKNIILVIKKYLSSLFNFKQKEK